jgi:hypothetical protein
MEDVHFLSQTDLPLKKTGLLASTKKVGLVVMLKKTVFVFHEQNSG